MIIKLKKIKKQSEGSLLLELLISMSLLAIIIFVGANAVFLSIKSSDVSRERDVDNTLASETLEGMRSIAEENWQNIYSLTKSNGHYYPTQSGGKWIIAVGDETVNFNGKNYTRYITINNVSRDSFTHNIQNTYSSTYDDPSTQKVSVTVSSPNGSPLTIYEYFFRWKNKICNQNSWATGGSGATPKVCPDTTYDTKDNTIDLSTGAIKLN